MGSYNGYALGYKIIINYAEKKGLVSIVMEGSDCQQGLDWRLDLLTTLTHDS
jgi:hypothetical protein